MRLRRVRCALACLLALGALGAGAAGCGGGSDGSSKKTYEGKINTFCTDVKTAAGRFQADATKLQASAATNRQKAIGTTLSTFADATESAVDKLRKADVPKSYASFNDRTVKAFDGVVVKLRAAAKGVKAGDVSGLLGLEAALRKLPNLPPDIAKRAKACADISS
jgi:hypothetical protein